jgi:hypothetical protein
VGGSAGTAGTFAAGEEGLNEVGFSSEWVKSMKDAVPPDADAGTDVD